MKSIQQASYISLIQLLIQQLSGLLLTPFIIARLGIQEYGLYILLGGWMAFLGLLHFGIHNVVIRYLTTSALNEHAPSKEEILGFILRLTFYLSIGMLLLSALLYPLLMHMYGASFNSSQLMEVKSLFIVMVAKLFLVFYIHLFTGYLIATEQMVLYRSLLLARLILQNLTILAVLFYWSSALSIVVVDAICTLILLLILLWIVFKKDKLIVRFNYRQVGLTKDIMLYAFWIFIFNLAHNIQWLAGQTILGLHQSTEMVAIFGIGMIIAGLYTAVAHATNQLLLPMATSLAVKNTSAFTYTQSMIKFSRINLLLLLPILMGFYLFGSLFLHLWLGPAFANAWEIAMVMMIVLTLPLLQAFGDMILEGMKKNKWKAIWSCISLCSASIIAYFLSSKYGIWGILTPFALAIIANSLILFVYYKKYFSLYIIVYFKKTLLKPLLINIIYLAIWVLVLPFFLLNSWTDLMVVGTIFILIYILVNTCLVMNNEEREYFFKFTKNKEI